MRRHFAVLWMCAAVALTGCSGSGDTAGVTETGNSEVTGRVVRASGVPASGVIVTLVPEGYDASGGPRLPVAFTTVTDDSGVFVFDRAHEATSYNIESHDAASGTRALVQGVVTSNAPITTPAATLRAPGAVAVSLAGGTYATGGFIYAAGTLRYVRIDAAHMTAGTVLLDSVPAASALTIAYRQGTGRARGVDTALAIPAGDTTVPYLLPSPWTGVGIGDTGVGGSVSYHAGSFSIAGGGFDTWEYTDEFYFVYQSFTGDGTITARIHGLQLTSAWSKAGVMFRDGLNANAANAQACVQHTRDSSDTTPYSQLATRTAPGDFSQAVSTSSAPAIFPQWMQLTREGNVFTARESTNGITWTIIGSATVPMAATVYAGLAVSSHNAELLNNVVIDNVSVR